MVKEIIFYVLRKEEYRKRGTYLFMDYQQITIKMPTDYSDGQLEKRITTMVKHKNFSWQVEKKSLDARKKSNIHWLLKVGITGKGSQRVSPFPPLEIPRLKSGKKVVVIGSGPAGIFSALVLQKAGFKVTLIERGADVKKRSAGINRFEKEGLFDPLGNYAFGEGGAGTFSDGKLTSRTKNISREKGFILESYIRAGGPGEIAWLAHPHLGSDNLRAIVRRLREELLGLGGNVLFETLVEDLTVKDGKVKEVMTSRGFFETDYVIAATGHSAFETYRMLIKRGVIFRTKNLAIGCRVEHPQELINRAQWGRPRLPGVKAAEYRLTFKGDGGLPVYTFCMCPGGTVVPAAAYGDTNIVNGMSLYKRNGKFANAACVAGINLEEIRGKETSPLDALMWLEELERSFYDFSGGFQAPCCSIDGFIRRKIPGSPVESSYPMGLKPAPLWELLPPLVSESLRRGLKTFTHKIKGFETGNILGLESKTSSPLQAAREENRLCTGFDNLYMAGEGSGYAGGIISSGTDGIKTAMAIIERG